MKPMGKIPGIWSHLDGVLQIAGRPYSHWLDQAAETPVFVYDLSKVEARIAQLRAAMPAELHIHYAMKANPLTDLVSAIDPLVDGLDIASGGELAIAVEAGVDPVRISFAGPGKREAEIAAGVEAGVTFNAESPTEVARIIKIAEARSIRPRIALRVNPDFELKGSGMHMGGRASAFGMDAERVPETLAMITQASAEWRGFHVYAGSQALDAEAVAEAQAATIDMVARLSDAAGMTPPHVNLGGGFGIPYFPKEEPLDIFAVGQQLSESLAQRRPVLADTQFAIELGRWMVGEAGVYLTRVIDRKVSKGSTFLIVDGGLHHQLAASGNFGTVVRRNYPLAVASSMAVGESDWEEVTVAGCLCTPLDKLGDQIGLPAADVGDVIAVFMAGAYGASASPSAFLGHGAAVEILARA